MADHKYPIEVQPDFLQKITGAQPVHALAEFIWNSVDADATIVSVGLQENPMGALSKIIVTDNGTGIKHDDAPELFKNLGGSWKRSRASTAEGGFSMAATAAGDSRRSPLDPSLCGMSLTTRDRGSTVSP